MALTDEQKSANTIAAAWGIIDSERAANARLIEQIAQLESNEKVLLAQIQGHTQWREKITKASEQAYGESAMRYKFSLTKNGKVMNTFPKAIDGRWFALVPAEDDGHIGHISRIAQLEQQLADAKRQMESQKDEWLSWEAKRKGLKKDAERIDWMERTNQRGHYCGVFSGNILTRTAIDAAIARTQEQG